MSYYGAPQYGAPPYGGGYGAPPPQFRPPPGPPPPLPPGWISEWEPNARRAFFVETATGRAQWEPPYGPSGYDGSRGDPGYYAPPAGPPPGYGGGYGGGYPQQGAVVVEERRSDSGGTGKMVAAGVGGLAVGALGGALIEHEIGE